MHPSQDALYSCIFARILKTNQWIFFVYGLGAFQTIAFVAESLGESVVGPFIADFPLPTFF